MDNEQSVHVETIGKSGKAGTLAVLCALLAISALLNVFLARKISHLRVENMRIAADVGLQVGASVPPLKGHAIDGTAMSIQFAAVPASTLVYVFSPQCSWCAKNLENFRALIAQANGRFRVVGLATTRLGLAEYLARERLTLPVLADLDPAVASAYELTGTPTTIVVSPEGKVLRIWSGAYADGIREEIETFLGVHLLPCCDAPAQR